MVRDGYDPRHPLSAFLFMADLFSKCSEKSQSLGGIWNDTNGALRSTTGISLVIRWLFIASRNKMDIATFSFFFFFSTVDDLIARRLKII